MTAQQPDLLDMLAELDREPYAGPAPLGVTFEYFTPAELLAAHEEAHRDWSWGMTKRRTWRLGITTGLANDSTGGHELWMLDVDLRCECRFPFLVDEWEKTGFSATHCCVGDLTYQANCPTCRWHAIFANENEAVEAWHDHAWPGWRDLPVVPYGLADHLDSAKQYKKRDAWISEHYPAGWQKSGAPIITERGKWGGRHVPRRSPWDGYDFASATQMHVEPRSKQSVKCEFCQHVEWAYLVGSGTLQRVQAALNAHVAEKHPERGA